MRIEYSFVEFHSPVFTQGKNHGTKIHAKEGVELWYDTDLRFMCMKYKGKQTDFDSFHSADRKIEDPKPELKAPLPTYNGIAQVSEPHKEVQGKRGRPPKYQGEAHQGE